MPRPVAARESEPTGVEPIPPWQAAAAIATVTQLANLTSETKDGSAEGLLSVASNEELWAALWSGGPVAGSRVELRSFALAEWAPLQPGISHRRSVSVAGATGGSGGILASGVACVRAQSLPGRQARRLLGATSSGWVHEGIAVVLNGELQASLACRIEAVGALHGTVYGVIRDAASGDVLSRAFGGGHPQYLVEASSIEPSTAAGIAGARAPMATVVLTLVSNRRRLGATCAAFRCGESHSYLRATDWLLRTRNRAPSGARVLSDFDMAMDTFADAVFSQGRLLSGRVDRFAARAVFEGAGLDGYLIGQLEAALERRGVFGPQMVQRPSRLRATTNVVRFPTRR